VSSIPEGPRPKPGRRPFPWRKRTHKRPLCRRIFSFPWTVPIGVRESPCGLFWSRCWLQARSPRSRRGRRSARPMLRLVQCRARWCSDLSARWRVPSLASRPGLRSRARGARAGHRLAHARSGHRKQPPHPSRRPRAVCLLRRRDPPRRHPVRRRWALRWRAPRCRRFRDLNRSRSRRRRPTFLHLPRRANHRHIVTIAKISPMDRKPAPRAFCF
jgi:hypothetical protein